MTVKSFCKTEKKQTVKRELRAEEQALVGGVGRRQQEKTSRAPLGEKWKETVLNEGEAGKKQREKRHCRKRGKEQKGGRWKKAGTMKQKRG